MSYSVWLAGQGAEEIVGFLYDGHEEPLGAFLGERGDIAP